MSQDLFDKAAALLKKARKGVALTGAGVSTESGIPDFRGKDGLWSRYDPHEYGTMGAFQAEPVPGGPSRMTPRGIRQPLAE